MSSVAYYPASQNYGLRLRDRGAAEVIKWLSIRRVVCSLGLLGILVSACASDSEEDQRTAEVRAQQLIDSMRGTELAPRLTVDVAVSLYGTDAADVCRVFEDGLDSTEYLLLLGNPSNRRSKFITERSVEYMRHVVDTYCPSQHAAFDDVVSQLDPIESDL